MMKGLHAEVKAKFHHSVRNYIMTSRILQGQEDLRTATVEEQKDIVLRFHSLRDELKGFASLKQQKEKEKAAAAAEPVTAPDEATRARGVQGGDFGPIPDEPPKTGFWNTRTLSFDERKKLHALKDAWKNKNVGEAAAAFLSPMNSNSYQQPSTSPAPAVSPSTQPASVSAYEPEDPEMERAIRESVVQTSHGDTDEDVVIEAQIRASVREMKRLAEEERRQAEEQGQEHHEIQMVDYNKDPGTAAGPTNTKAVEAGVRDDITDEEFEALVAEAARQSMIAQTQGGHVGGGGVDEDEYLKRALEESKGNCAGSAGDDDEELRKVIEESQRAHREDVARRSTERSEEEIIMEYVKKQSLAEEEFRRQKAKGKQAGGAAAGEGGGDEDDEELKKALEESLRMSGKGGGGSSSA